MAVGVLHRVDRMTQRERIMARLQAMPDNSLHEVETFLDFMQFKYAAMESPALIAPHGDHALAMPEGMPKGMEVRWDVLRRVQLGFQRVRGDRAQTLTLYELYMRSGPTLALARPTFHEILVELSSPLVGYLGREEGICSDRDYFWLAKI